MTDLTYTALKNLPPVLTADEVAAVLRIPKSSVYDLASRGKLPCVKLGRTWRMSKVQLLQFLGLSVSVPESMSMAERG